MGTHTDKALSHDEVQGFTRLNVESSIACVTLGESFLLYGPIKWSDQMTSKGSCTGAALDSMNYLWKQLVGSTSTSGRLQVGKGNQEVCLEDKTAFSLSYSRSLSVLGD